MTGAVALIFLAFLGFGVYCAAMLFGTLWTIRYVRQYFRRGRHHIAPDHTPLLVLQWRHEKPPPPTLAEVLATNVRWYGIRPDMDTATLEMSSVFADGWMYLGDTEDGVITSSEA